jgi:hypothetical protein
MAKKSSVLNVMRRAAGAVLKNLPTVLPLVLFAGVLVGVADQLFYEWIQSDLARSSAQVQQSAFIKVMFGWWGIMLVFEVFFGPILGAAAVFVGRSHSQGSKVTLYKALNFAINRYGRLFKWHAAAWLSIHVGMLVLVPGILFMLQYAFVDAVATLENEPWPLGRSKKLTRGRRRRIFAVALILLVFSQVAGFAELDAIERGVPYLIGLISLMYLMSFLVQVAFYMFYEDRTTPTPAAG